MDFITRPQILLPETVLFAFRGGYTLQAAAVVCRYYTLARYQYRVQYGTIIYNDDDAPPDLMTSF